MLRLSIIGNLGKDAATRDVNGRTVINFTIAHTEKWRDKSGQEQSKTRWFDCSYWSDKASIAQYLKKGKEVYVEGIPEARAFTKADGSMAASINIDVKRIQLLGGGSAPAHQEQPANFSVDADLPF